METEYAIRQYEAAAALLPGALRGAAERVPPGEKGRAEEFRLRLGRPAMVSGPEGEHPLPDGEHHRIRAEDLTRVLEIASRASAHTVLDQVRNGFITIRGGHRVGICGNAVVQDGAVHNIRHPSSLSIRIAKEVRDAGEGVISQLLDRNGLPVSTLILSPPGGGKTTLLRDLIRRISNGTDAAPLRVGVADERGELAALWEGMPQMDLGDRTDVMDGCPKGTALLMLLRGMTPQVLAVDELTDPADAAALEQAAGCGVTLLCTAHGGGAADLWTRPVYRRLMEAQLFQRVVLIQRQNGRRLCRVSRMEERELC